MASDLTGGFRDAVPFAPVLLAVARPVPVSAAADLDAAALDAFPDVADFLAAALDADGLAGDRFAATAPDLEAATLTPDLAAVFRIALPSPPTDATLPDLLAVALFLIAVRLAGDRFAATAPDLDAATLAPVLADADLTDAVFPDVALFLVAVLLAAGFLAVPCLAEAVPAVVAVLADAGFFTLVSAPVFEDLPAGALPVDLREAAPEPEPGLRAALAAELREGAEREGAWAVIGFLHFTTSRSYRYHFPELSAPPG